MSDITDLSLQTEADALVLAASEIVVDNSESFERVAGLLRTAKLVAKKAAAHYEERRKATYAAAKAVTDEIKKYTDLASRIDAVTQPKIRAWRERVRKEEAERAAAEERERRAKAEEKALDTAIATGDESILDEPITVPALPPAAPPKVEGMIFVPHWKFRCLNFAEVPEAFKMLDEPKIQKVVDAMKAQTNIKGIEVFMEERAQLSPGRRKA